MNELALGHGKQCIPCTTNVLMALQTEFLSIDRIRFLQTNNYSQVCLMAILVCILRANITFCSFLFVLLKTRARLFKTNDVVS